jgi:predicted nucleic acid-binding protein
MKKIFVDSDVILDLLIDSEPFNDDIAEILENSIRDRISVCVSSVTITNLNYIIGRIENRNSAAKKTAKILKLVKVENVGESTVNKSIASKFKDFEDGVQNFCAEESKHKILITRNTKDYKESDLAIMTPKEYLTCSK